MNRCGYLLAAALTATTVVSAQERPPAPAAEIGLNYSLFRTNSAPGTNGITNNGGSGYFVYNVNHVMGLVADFGGYHNGSANGSFDNGTTFTYLFGPRFNYRKSRFNPYVQFLFGGARVSAVSNLDGTTASSDRNGFASAAGGGIDIELNSHIAVKPVQVEYVMTQIPTFASDRNFQNDLRYSAGVVFRFGQK